MFRSETLPLVSILIPCRNAASTICDALHSAIVQTWPRKEIIVVDDGSNDGSAALVEQFRGSNVVLLRGKGRGAAAARNEGLRAASGDFIQYLDADDILSPDKITLQMEGLQSAAGALVACGWQRFDRVPGDALKPVDGIFRDLSVQGYFELYLNDQGDVPHGCWLIPRDVAIAAGPWNETLSNNDDGEYSARLVAASTGVTFVGTGPLYFYRSSPGSLSALDSSDKVRSAMRALDLIAEEAARWGIDLDATKLGDKYYRLLIGGFPWSWPHERELRRRIERWGGQMSAVRLGGKGVERVASIVGWKAVRVLQVAKQSFLRRRCAAAVRPPVPPPEARDPGKGVARGCDSAE